MTVQLTSGPWARVLDLWRSNTDLLRNAGSLAATTGLTSVFGFVYWIIAAREFSAQAVGYGSAAISAMTLLGTIGMFGLGTMLIGELPRKRLNRGGLTTASIAASGLGSLALGLGFPLVMLAFGDRSFPELTGTPARLGLFAVGVALTGATLVFDEATIGLLRGGVQLSRNLAMSLIKLIALPLAAVVLHDAFGVGILFAWVLGTAISLIPATLMLRRDGAKIFRRPDWDLLRRLGKVAMAHNWLNLAIATPPKLIPVLITVVVSPSANAAFYVAWMLASFLFMVPGHLSTVLFAIASASPELIAEKLRFVLRVSLLIGLPVMAALALGAHFALNLFGPSYAHLATVPLWLLIIGYIPGLPKAQYIAVCRATGEVGKAAVVLTIAACCECAAVVIGGKAGGLDGLSFAYLGVMIIEGIITAPTVLRAAYVKTKAATGAFPVIPATSAPAASGPMTRLTGPLARLTGPMPGLSSASAPDTGLAALAALATAAVSEGHSLDLATEVWRTGGFPAIPLDSERSRRAALAETGIDLYGGRPLEVPVGRLSYRHRQQAGLDALVSLAAREDPPQKIAGVRRGRHARPESRDDERDDPYARMRARKE
jgi:O-antigen/teichoic acid export membrane protein